MGNEADWKRFKCLVPKVRERYLEQQNALLLQVLSAANRTQTERFWDTFEQMKDLSKVLRDCLDDHRRSKMVMDMLLMLHVGMLVQDDLAEFSDELQARLKEHMAI